MRTRNSNFPNNSNVTIPRRRNKGRAPNIVEPELRTIVAPMAERTMEELLRAPTEGYGEAIVLPEINADHFEIKTNLLQLVQANPFHGLENENPHAHINSFKRITSTLRFRNVPNDVIKLMMFPYSLEGAAKTWMNTTSRESVSKKGERIGKLADQLSTLVEIVSTKFVTLALVKAVEETCVTCGGSHSWYNCQTTDNNQASVCATTVTYNQVNLPNQVSNQMTPPGFPPVQQNQGNNQNRYNQNRGNNYNHGPIYRPRVNQPSAYQALAPQTQGVSKEDFQNYIKANDAVMKNMQNKNQNMQNQMTNLTNLLTNFVNSNTASTSGSGSLPSNTIANPKGDIKAITTRSGISYNGTQVPPPLSSLPKVVERETDVTKDTVPPTNNESTKDVQPPVVQVETHVLIFEPVFAPVSALKPNLKPSIPYPSRLNDQKIREKANNQIEKFYQIFQDLHFDISFADALILDM
ncbi:hypothetical protein Tco_1198349 [Tanacetum coccineum]